MLKELHDRLMEMRPEGASHDETSCPVCLGVEVASEHPNEVPKGGSVKTYSEDEYNALLSQVADLEVKVKELDGVRHESEVEARIAEAKAAADAQVEDLQSKLDTAVLEVKAAQDEAQSVREYFEAMKAAHELAEQREALKAERVAKVKEVASFDDEYINARADAWAALDEEAFEAALADWKAISGKAPVSTETTLPAATAMTASRESNPSKDGSLRDVMRLRFQGVDTRNV